MAKLKPLPRTPADQPAQWTLADVEAVQAVFQGRAEEAQQKRAMRWILRSACLDGEWGFHDSPRHTDLALGRQFVAQQIAGLLKLDLSKLRSAHVQA